MPVRTKWLLGLAAAALLAGAWIAGDRDQAVTLEELAGRLPQTDRLVARIDVAALRHAGLLEKLAGKAGLEEGEYQQFVAGTGFDYRTDLDTVLTSYSSQETHFFLIGRFDWAKIRDFAGKQGGVCGRRGCRLDSPTPGRQISFTSINSTTMALASSSDGDAVRRLASPAEPMASLPRDPVWMLLPAAALKDKDGMPAGTRTIASAVEDANRVVLGIGPKDSRFEARLEARFPTGPQATAAQKQLQSATDLLNKMMARDKLAPNPKNLTSVLSGGQFRVDGAVLSGTWPVESALLE